MNLGEYGNILRIDVGEDIKNNINSMVITSPYISQKKLHLSASNGLTVGLVDLITPLGKFKANEYLEYTIKDGDFDVEGVWQVRVSSINGGIKAITDKVVSFIVNK